MRAGGCGIPSIGTPDLVTAGPAIGTGPYRTCSCIIDTVDGSGMWDGEGSRVLATVCPIGAPAVAVNPDIESAPMKPDGGTLPPRLCAVCCAL